MGMAKLTSPLTLTSPFFFKTPSHDSSIPLYTRRIQIFIRFFSTTLLFRDMAKLTSPLTLTSPFFSETPSHDSSIPLYTRRVQIFIWFFSTTLRFRDMAKLTSPLTLTLTLPFFSEEFHDVSLFYKLTSS